MHRFAIISLFIAFCACSKSNDTEQNDEIDKKVETATIIPDPAIVPVTQQQKDLAVKELKDNRKNTEAQLKQQMEEMLERALQRYGDKPLSLVSGGTDSVNGGIDGWRTCAKFGPQQLGLPPDTIAVFNDQKGVYCAKNPSGYVAQILIIGPEGIEAQILQPTYKTEKMVIMFGDVASIKKK